MKKTLRDYAKYILRENNYVSHSFEPVSGDKVKNINPGCKHYGSEGIVVKVVELPKDMGKGIAYKCTNDGSCWSTGDVLYKTMDQLGPVR